ncbi:MAG: L-2-amino-thiazoline-4-carboxylic acid hydrolase [Syntrophobacteraceae bacterium]
MSELIEKISAEARWQIATKGLTGAWMACANALKQAVGEAKYNEFNGEFWSQAGKGVKEFVDAFGLPVGDAREIEEAIELAVRAVMGPEWEFEVVEATRDRCAARVSKCPYHERWKEQGLGWDFCKIGHRRWGDGVVESLNPDFAHSLPKTMPGGDPYCEFIVERKK